MSDLPMIWRVLSKSVAVPGETVRYNDAIYDETPGYIGCTVRSWLGDGYVTWDFQSRRYTKTDGDGGWRRAT